MGTRIERTAWPTQRSPRKERPKHLDLIRELPCLVCRSAPVEAAHVRMGSLRWLKRETGKAEKPSDVWVVPLCPDCHREQHSMGEAEFWERVGINPFRVCALLALHSGDLGVMLRVVLESKKERRQ